MKKFIAWMKKADNCLTVGLVVMCIAVSAFLYGYSSNHNAKCDGCKWFWCHNYTGGGMI